MAKLGYGAASTGRLLSGASGGLVKGQLYKDERD